MARRSYRACPAGPDALDHRRQAAAHRLGGGDRTRHRRRRPGAPVGHAPGASKAAARGGAGLIDGSCLYNSAERDDFAGFLRRGSFSTATALPRLGGVHRHRVGPGDLLLVRALVQTESQDPARSCRRRRPEAGLVTRLAENVAPKLKPKKGGKRGRVLRTDAGREVAHEEVLIALVKRTAVVIAHGGACKDCGGPVENPAKGRVPLRCPLCAVEANRARARQRCRDRQAEERGRYTKSLTQTLSHAQRRAETHRAGVARARAARIAAGLCVQCGKEPSWNGTRRGEACRAKRKRGAS